MKDRQHPQTPTRPPTSTELMLEALGTIQQQSERHRQAIEELQKLTHRPPAQAERKTLTATAPLWEADLGTEGVESIALLNFSTVTAYIGIAGRSAAQGNGIAVAPLSYIVLPLRTNVLDVGIDPATAPVGGADVVILRYDHVQAFEAGPLAGSAGGGGGGQVSPLPGSTWDTSDRVGRLLGHVTVDNAVDVFDRAARLLGVADISDRAARALGLVGPAAGATWDIADRAARLLGVADISDRAARALGLVGPAAGSTWDVADRAARALGAVSAAGGSTWDVSDRVARLLGVITQKEQWAISQSAGVNAQATVTRAAGGVGHHHVCRAIEVELRVTAAASSTIAWALRDGATGAGTVLAQGFLSTPATIGAVDRIVIPDLNIAGSDNTAMTLETPGGAGAGSVLGVNLVGYTT